MCAEHGWSESQCADLGRLWDRESGWSSRAHNASSGAHGIPQALPGRKMASHGSDWATSARTQIAWGLDYIADSTATQQCMGAFAALWLVLIHAAGPPARPAPRRHTCRTRAVAPGTRGPARRPAPPTTHPVAMVASVRDEQPARADASGQVRI